MGFGGFNDGSMGGPAQDFGMEQGWNPMFAQRPRPMKQRHFHLNVEDRYVMAKHASIYPGQEELDTILGLVDVIEKALKKVSDKLLSSGSGSAGEREVMGVARVGDLAKGLLLTGDKEVHLVLMCRAKPTIHMLHQIADALKAELNVKVEKVAVKEEEPKEKVENGDDAKEKFEIYPFPDEACFSVTTVEEESGDVPFQVRVSLTSTAHRQQDTEEAKQEAKPELKEESLETEGKLLCAEKCLESLAELRHTKWFSVMASPIPSCVEVIRILRDMAQREAAWAPLGPWATELLVERALFSTGQNLSPGNCLLRIMEVIASGIVMPDGKGLRDPCEREAVDVLASMSSQEREDVTKSAQVAVRKVHFRKLYEVLGMERFPPKKKPGEAEVKNIKDEIKSETSVGQKES